jgi:hypothetical protein
MPQYVTRFGSLARYDKGGVEVIKDDARLVRETDASADGTLDSSARLYRSSGRWRLEKIISRPSRETRSV